jgi:hypothetical protein
MNNTKKRTLTIVAVLMAATLVVGAFAAATTIATTQTAFAYPQKKDNKKDGKDGGGNGNGNTITIQACKQLASQSGWDNDQEQECQNLICTHPGENATCVQEGARAAPVSPVKKTCEQCFMSLLTQAQINSLLRILNVASLKDLCADLQNHIIAGLELEDALSQVTPSVSDETLVALQDCLRDVGIVFGPVG